MSVSGKSDIGGFLLPVKQRNNRKGKEQEKLNTEAILEFDKVKEKIKEFTHTAWAKKEVEQLHPFLSQIETEAALRDTSEAKLLLEKNGRPPLTSLDDMENMIEKAEAGGFLLPEELEQAAVVLTAVKRLKDYLRKGNRLDISLPYYEENLNPLEDIRAEIQEKIRGGRIDSHATKLLKTIRLDIEKNEEKMREKADAVLRAEKKYMSDNFSTMRNGHLCIPVKKEYRQKIKGSVIDVSATGSTVFMEPQAAGRYYDILQGLVMEEENEERKILYTLTGLISDNAEIFRQNSRMIEKLDFIFAKGEYAAACHGVCPEITMERRIVLKNGRHPLLDRAINVPLDFSIGNGINGIIITGPNTGGKTVAIKTVALNCLMAQCGLHVCCEEAVICMNSNILCDIGDGQSLSENLSTFSAHIKNILDILRKADKNSLVVMDELGSGTDPAEGMGIAEAVLDELHQSDAFYLVTTHYPEIKNYAEQKEYVVNARMEFDRETLRPLYRLVIGEAGESCAFYIAQKLGMPDRMLKKAAMAAYGDEHGKHFDGKNKNGELVKERGKRLQGRRQKKTGNLHEKFRRGDSVMVCPDRKKGIVCGSVDEKGIVQVQMPYGKIRVSHKRVKLLVKAEELYPEDYDFSIVFDTVENRKLRHKMERKYVRDEEIRIEIK